MKANIEYIQMFNIVVYVDWRAEYKGLHSEFEFSPEYRPRESNIELYIRLLNRVLNMNMESRIQSVVE